MQVTVDISYGDSVFTKSAPALERWLRFATRFIGMTVIGGPWVLDYQGKPPGLTGVVILAESHIAVHTFREYGTACIDIFSCKDFDMEKVEAMIKRSFKTNHLSIQLVERSIAIGGNR